MARQEVDLLLVKWDGAWVQLARAEGLYEASGCKRRPRHRTRCCGCWGAEPAWRMTALCWLAQG